jgi:hypothetical protein
MGAGSWKPQHTQTLAGARVVIVVEVGEGGTHTKVNWDEGRPMVVHNTRLERLPDGGSAGR